jgi:hypothetical protein
MVHRIRNIHIYEADYNFVLKIKWAKAIHHGEKYKLLHDLQYGSRRHRSSLDPVFIELMQQEIAKHNHLPYLQSNYDAQACYDRIIPKVAIAISKRYGVHENILQIFRQILQNSKYYVKIGNQVYQHYYGNSMEIPIYGTGQGSGCSPYIWLLLSSELFSLYCDKATGSELQAPFESQKSTLYVTAYVDDVNTHHSFQSRNTIKEILRQAESSAQRWYNILHISGGQLSNTKCSYYLHQMQSQSTG